MEAARLAEAADLARLTELAGQAVDELSDQRGGPLLLADLLVPGPDGLEQLLAGYLGCDDATLLAGTLDGAVLGVAAVRSLRGTGRVELLYVEPPARGVGLGAALMDAAVTWCTGRGCSGVDAPVLPGNRAAKQFFEGAGLVARLIVMHRPL